MCINGKDNFHASGNFIVEGIRILFEESLNFFPQFCQGFGFICEFCNDDRDIIFPFQLHKVLVCPGIVIVFKVLVLRENKKNHIN